MELAEGIETRRSCRAFTAKPVPKELIERILKIASKSPSYTNSQPWEVAVVTGKQRDKLSNVLYEMAKAEVTVNSDLPMPKVWPLELDKRSKEHGARRFAALGIDRDNKEQRNELRLMNFKFYGAPCVLFLFMDRTLTQWSIFDLGLFAQSLILAAHSFGLGACLQASLANYPDAVREFLGIGKTKLLVLGISMGYPDLKAPINTYISTRVSPNDFVKWYID